ncbi:MAG: hypothetical protein L0241_08020 [Planctomycetia bacterium]|nr:hypothetical protein [Planctomycetia bacterium]
MSPELFAFTGAADRVAVFAIKCLAVAGGFLIGYFLGGVIAWALDRWVFAKKSPEALKKVVSIVCGIALAILVALIVFGEGGSGLFGGGGGTPGDGKGAPDSEDKGKTPPAPPTPPEPKDKQPKIEIKPPDPKPGSPEMRVVIRAGADVKNGEFYEVDGDPNPKSLATLKEIVDTRRKDEKGELMIFFRFKSVPLPPGHAAMRELDKWLKEAKILHRFD